MPKQYLEIDSSYRNRNLYPNPASFTIQTNLYNTETTRLNAVDPVCDSASIVSWQPGNFGFTFFANGKLDITEGINLKSTTKKIAVIGGFTDYATSGTNILELTSLISTNGNGVLQPSKNYYYGATIQVDTPSQTSRILSYEYIDNNICVIKTKTNLIVTSASVISIVNPSREEIFVPNGPHSSSFNGYYIYNKTTNTYATISSYDIDRSTIKFFTQIPDTFYNIIKPNYDSFEIRKTKPKIFNESMTYLNSTTITASLNPLSFPFKEGLDISNVQQGDFIESSNEILCGIPDAVTLNTVTLKAQADDSYILIGSTLRLIIEDPVGNFFESEMRKIVSYTNKVVTVDIDFSIPIVGLLKYMIFLKTGADRITKIVNETFTVTSIDTIAQTISILKNTNASIESGFYKDLYISRPLAAAVIYGYIIDHTVVKTSIVLTNTLKVNVEFLNNLNTGDTITINIHSCMLSKDKFDNNITAKQPNYKTIDSFSVLGFSRDNRVFMKGGTDYLRTVIDEVDITLTTLILPNRPLKCSKGGFITEYPYVYVRFLNPAIFKPNYFLSNSNHTEGFNFRVPITNFVDDQTTDFVTLITGDMTYTTMFTFSEDLEFQVTLPDGSIFETIDSDFESPLSSNSNLQISAFFELKKTQM